MTMTDSIPRAVASDGKAWEATNTDGRTNASSFEVLAACGLTDAAHGLLARNTPGELPDPAMVLRIAGALLVMADVIQTSVTGGRPDRMASSHTRARGFLRTTLDVVGLPAVDASDDTKNAWREQVVTHASTLFRGAVAFVA